MRLQTGKPGMMGKILSPMGFDLEDKQLIAIDTGAPGGVYLHNDAIFQLKHGIGSIIGSSLIGFTLLIETLRDMGCAQTHHGAHWPK